MCESSENAQMHRRLHRRAPRLKGNSPFPCGESMSWTRLWPPMLATVHPQEASVQVQDVMTRNVIAIRANAPITEAITLMLRTHVSGLPVLDEQNALVGMLSEGDLLRRGEHGTEKKRPRWIEFLLGPGKM